MRRFLFVLCIFLVACQFEEQLTPETLFITTPEENMPVDNTTMPLTLTSTIVSIDTPLPEPSITPTPTPTQIPTSVPTDLPAPSPTSAPSPTISLEDITAQLLSSITISEEIIEDDVKLSRVSGWDEGFRSIGYCRQGAFQWLDKSHLLLFPVVGKEDSGFGFYLFTRPIMLDLDTGETWLIPIANSVDCELPAWSDTMQSLIVLWQDEFLVLNTQGDILNRFPGRGNPYLSPSGSKFFAYDTWYDLQSGQISTFANSPITSVSEKRYYDSPPGWSDDEMRLARNSFAFADANSGETFLIEERNEYGGHGGAPGQLFDIPFYFLNDNLVLYDMPFIQEEKWLIPLIDLQAKKLVDIQSIIGAAPETDCQSIRNIDSNSFLVINCGDVWYVIDPQSLTIDSRFLPSANPPVFSADDKYAVLTSPESQYLLWENESSELYELNISPLADPYNRPYMVSFPVGRWGPQGNWFSFWTNEFEILSFLNPVTKDVNSISFPYANGKITQEFWSRSEDSVALLDSDDALWWVSDLGEDGDAELVNPPEVKFMGEFWQEDEQALLLYDENGRFWKFSFADAQLEPLTTTPFETIHINSVKFSPDGTKAAFTVGTGDNQSYRIEGSEIVVLSLESEE